MTEVNKFTETVLDKEKNTNDFLLFPSSFEPGTFHMLSERDNHYTTETDNCVVVS